MKEILNQTEDKWKLTGHTYGKDYFKENFIPLLELGQQYEKIAVSRIISHYNYENPKITFNNDNRYDIKINKKTYEVKLDIKAVKMSSLNISEKKPSGISITESKYYLIVIPYEPEETFLLIKVRKLKELIQKETFFKPFTPNKYNNFSGGYIFTLKTLKAIAKLI